MIYPFKFPFNIVSILPKEIYNYMENITAVIMGVNEKYDEKFFEKNGIELNQITLIVDIDQRFVKIFGDKKEIPDLPEKYKNILAEKLNTYINNNINDNNNIFQLQIREYFLDFLVDTFKKYPKYLKNSIYSHKDYKNFVESSFDIKEFLNDAKNEYKNFYQKFFETQSFCDYILKRMTPKEKNEQIEVLFFEEKIIKKINSKKNKKIPTNFLSYENTTKKIYSVNKPLLLTQEQINFFSEKKLNLIKDGLYINENSTKKNIQFNYIIFPRLQSEFILNSDLKKIFFFPSLSDDLNIIIEDLISNSNLNTIKVNSNEMENYIYLLWLKIWAFTFWYLKEDEKIFRFNEMLKVIDKIENYEIEVINNLFESLLKNKVKEELIVKLYEKIIENKINPSTFIYDAIKKIMIKNKKNINKNYKNKHFNIKNFDKNSKNCFNKRTLKNKYDSTILNSNLIIFTIDKKVFNCNFCDKNLNLKEIINNLNDAKKDLFWAKCSNCNKTFLPIIKVKFGNEISNKIISDVDFFSVDNITLYSPYTLYYQLDKILIKDNKLNVDELNFNFRSYLWNFILYFKIKKLPYDFFLPYENDVEFYDSKEINFNEKESFNVEIKPNFMYKYYKNEDLDEIKTDEIIIEKSLKLLIPKEKKSVFVSKQINNNNNSEENNYNNLLISYDENSSMNSSNNDSHYLKINRNSTKNIKSNLSAVKEDENENIQTTSSKLNKERSLDEISSINELNLDEENNNNNEKNKFNNNNNNFFTTKIKNVHIYQVNNNNNNKKNNFFVNNHNNFSLKTNKNSEFDKNHNNNIKIISIINKNIEKIRKDSTPIKKILTDNEKIINKFRNYSFYIKKHENSFINETKNKKRLKSQEQKNIFNI